MLVLVLVLVVAVVVVVVVVVVAAFQAQHLLICSLTTDSHISSLV